MITHPSQDFLALVEALLFALSPSEQAPDAVLTQLHALFGPMLVSALQLVDRRDVVKVSLPGGRFVHQVTSSAGAPYTLYLDLPSPPVVPAADLTQPPTQAPSPTYVSPKSPASDAQAGGDASNEAQGDDASPLSPPSQAPKLGRMICPCTGFAFNTLTAPRSIFCKHILAVLLADRLGKVVDTTVPLAAAAGLLGLGGAGG
ncbi:Zinc finger SWIM domain-containing protein 7 [Vanrija pseudolonga]|uniref:Zinc finger SWIM domain-containing protein 7 n=1 Tax=Vanrija pseudolonga TaxID=143232 RepID=A0AAF0YHZ9_9TREE|nr:Zinc finger SWIM domain-containing protein 7 [Vanrija pseudolonga]